MYIDKIAIENFRTFRKTEIQFCHKDLDFEGLNLPRPLLPNINLVLANNGYGKTSFLRAIALAALGPAVSDSGIFAYRLIRRETNKKKLLPASLKATFSLHEQDATPVSHIVSSVGVLPEGDLELLRWTNGEEKAWHPVFSSNTDAFFMVGYGATRRVSKSSRFEQSTKSSPRASRIMGLFEEDFFLRPLNTWLPQYKASKKLRGRYVQAVHLLNNVLKDSDWTFLEKQDKAGEYLFGKKGTEVPFPALSDGYRAFIGWIGDLLFHICETCPSGKMLYENRGIVMVDEIDLHLHPKWQQTVIQTLAEHLPNIQFIFTSHSPLIVGSLEWMNIILMKTGPNQTSKAERLEWAVHGLDADQVLLSDFFGLKSTRAAGRKSELKDLGMKASEGDKNAAEQLLLLMSKGQEATRSQTKPKAPTGRTKK